jgi:hypothetical protein
MKLKYFCPDLMNGQFFLFFLQMQHSLVVLGFEDVLLGPI